MREGATATRLASNRLHLRHGPIDLIVSAEGDRETAFSAAGFRFCTILEELVVELPILRQPLGHALPNGRVAQRMVSAVRPFSDVFITPMAAVAGAVADEILHAMTQISDLSRACVNNGGDIALHLAPSQQFMAAMASGENHDLGRIRIKHDSGIGGIATSGRHGRSHSLGIADSVTVLAKTAALADAAATLIANAVDLPDHPGITRVRSDSLFPDSDLAARLVTTGCAKLAPDEIETALTAGARTARNMLDRRLIHGAALFLQGQSRVVGCQNLGADSSSILSRSMAHIA